MGWIGFSCKPELNKYQSDLRQHCKDYPKSPLALAMAVVEPHARAAGVLAAPEAGMGWICTHGYFANEGWNCHAIGDIWFPDDENIYVPKGPNLSYHFRCLEKNGSNDIRWLSMPELDGFLVNGSPGEPGHYWVNLSIPAQIEIQKKAA